MTAVKRQDSFTSAEDRARFVNLPKGDDTEIFESDCVRVAETADLERLINLLKIRRDEVLTNSVNSDRGCSNMIGCFARVCHAAGVIVGQDVSSVADMNDADLAALAGKTQFKVWLVAYGLDDKRNHIELVPGSTAKVRAEVDPITETPIEKRTVACTSMQHFFNRGNEWRDYKFYADTGFGSEAVNTVRPDAFNGNQRAQSVVGESVHGGGSNVSGGVTRSKRRNITAKSNVFGGPVAKNYRASNAVLFNNADELFQDKISREYAQEIIEELFELWGVPFNQPEAVKYAEDLLWTFLIAVTASNKADYNRYFDIPVKPLQRSGETVSVLSVNFADFSRLLEAGHGKTRRQFARGVADDLRAFLRMEENQSLLPALAARIGCETLMAYLAFDGSTHCTNMTSREITFTKTLESRNLFERDDIVAQGSSDKLMQGMSGGIRSVAPR